MNALKFSLLALAGLALVVGAATAADDDDIPTFKKRGDMEKAFAAKVGTAVVKTARSGPSKIEYEKHELNDTDTYLKEMKITMSWVGGLTKKKFTSTIVLTLYTKDKEAWKVLDLDYKDDNNISPLNPNYRKMRDLKDKLNR